MKTDLVLSADLSKRLHHQAELDGLSLGEMVERLVSAMEEEENGLDGRAYRLDPERYWKDYDASTSPEDNRRRLEQWVPGK
jgi:hypothetical protein